MTLGNLALHVMPAPGSGLNPYTGTPCIGLTVALASGAVSIASDGAVTVALGSGAVSISQSGAVTVVVGGSSCPL